MFSHLFNCSHKKRHLANLIKLAKADGYFHMSEYEFLLIAARKYGVSVKYLQKIQKNNPSNVSYHLPKSSLERFHYWYDLMNMVLADSIIHEKELEFCSEMAKSFGYKPEIVSVALHQIQAGKSYEQLYEILKQANLLEN